MKTAAKEKSRGSPSALKTSLSYRTRKTRMRFVMKSQWSISHVTATEMNAENFMHRGMFHGGDASLSGRT